MSNELAKFSDLVGCTLTDARNENDERIVFTLDDGRDAWLYHSQDCCEYVRVEEIHGDLADLVGAPILLAEEVEFDEGEADDSGRQGSDDCWKWTFYKLATVKGHVTIRWLGESNGYYGVSVYFAADAFPAERERGQ